MKYESLRRIARARAGALLQALGQFARGFVGETRLPRERHAACCALSERASGRGRCC